MLRALSVGDDLGGKRLEHLGERAPLVTTVNETSMAFRLGQSYGVEVFETPVGFKYVGPKMIETGATHIGVATDHVIGGTGDLEGVTGFGRTQQTNDDGGGAFGSTATMELMLALPSN